MRAPAASEALLLLTGQRVTRGSLARECDSDLGCGGADLVHDNPDLNYGGVAVGRRPIDGGGRAGAAPPDLGRRDLDPRRRPRGWPSCPVARQGG